MTDAEHSSQETEPAGGEDRFAADASRRGQTEEVKLDKNLYQPFSVGDVRKIQSTPNNEPPSKEDTIPGRYASVLFTTASMEKALFDVYEDMKFLSELYSNSESFKLFTENAGIGINEIRMFNKSL